MQNIDIKLFMKNIKIKWTSQDILPYFWRAVEHTIFFLEIKINTGIEKSFKMYENFFTKRTEFFFTV